MGHRLHARGARRSASQAARFLQGEVVGRAGQDVAPVRGRSGQRHTVS